MTNLLFDEYPLVILPKLAETIGLNEAIILQQLHYWLKKSTHIIDGIPWVYNTYEEWKKQFPFWGLNTIRRAIAKLEEEGLIKSGNFNKMKIDKTKWYTINYQRLEELQGLGSPSAQNGQSSSPKWADQLLKMGKAIPETTTEINPETTKVRYADYVSMKEKEYNKLVESYGEPATQQMITTLDNYKGSKGKTYKDDYRAILSWVVDKLKNEKPHLFQQQEERQLTDDEIYMQNFIKEMYPDGIPDDY